MSLKKKKKLIILSSILMLMMNTNCSKDADNLTFAIGTIDAITPTSGPGDTEVTISVNGLSSATNIDNITVFFNNQEAVVNSATPTEIKAIVPRGALTGIVTIMANGQEVIGPEFNYVITPGQVTTLTSSGPSSGNLDGPITDVRFTLGFSITIDTEGNLYVSEFGGNRIRKIDTDLMVSTLVNRDRPVQAVFSNSFTTITSNGNLISCNSTEHTIEEISLSDGTLTTLAGTGTAGTTNGAGNNAQFSTPTGIDMDSNNNIYISDSRNHSIRKIDPTNEVTTFAGSGEPGLINGDPSTAQFAVPYSLAIAPDGTIFVADFRNHVIRKIAMDGTVSTFAGTGDAGFADGPAANAQFHFPTDIKLSNDGNLYVTDINNHRIRQITPEGMVSTYAGNGDKRDADGFLTESSFDFVGDGTFVAGGIAIDSNNVIYVTTINGAIRKITPEF